MAILGPQVGPRFKASLDPKPAGSVSRDMQLTGSLHIRVLGPKGVGLGLRV